LQPLTLTLSHKGRGKRGKNISNTTGERRDLYGMGFAIIY